MRNSMSQPLVPKLGSANNTPSALHPAAASNARTIQRPIKRRINEGRAALAAAPIHIPVCVPVCALEAAIFLVAPSYTVSVRRVSYPH